jgi:hypothetical protein
MLHVNAIMGGVCVVCSTPPLHAAGSALDYAQAPDENHVGLATVLLCVRGEEEVAATALLDHLVQPRLIDRQVVAVPRGNAGLVAASGKSRYKPSTSLLVCWRDREGKCGRLVSFKHQLPEEYNTTQIGSTNGWKPDRDTVNTLVSVRTARSRTASAQTAHISFSTGCTMRTSCTNSHVHNDDLDVRAVQGL